jgi:hypothetical protein
VDTKDIFNEMYREARRISSLHEEITAFWAAENATNHFFDTFGYSGFDIDHVLSVANAVLWAIHWNRMPQEPLKLWQYERRKGFILASADSGEESRVWFERPRLPA